MSVSVPPDARTLVSSSAGYPEISSDPILVGTPENQTSFIAGQSVRGDAHCFVEASGKVACLGEQSAWNTEHTRVTTPALDKVSSMSLGLAHGCALTDKGVLCWGANVYGAVGDGHAGYQDVQPNAKPTSVIAQSLMTRAGEFTTCALLPDRTLRCAKPGDAFAQTASDVLTFDLEGDPMPKAGARRYEQLCIVGMAGSSYCLGDRGGSPFSALARLGGRVSRTDVQMLVASADRLVALTRGGHVMSGPLARLDGKVEPHALPTVVIEAVVDSDGRALHNVEQVDCGVGHCCARSASDVWCWGANDKGQLGSRLQDGTGRARLVTLPAKGTPISLSVHADRSCAVVAGDGVYCWGERLPSDLPGDGGAVVERIERTTDAQVVSVGGRHVCARLRSGQVRCWGQSALGVAGDSTSSRLPLNVQGLTDARDLGCGADHCCATRTSGQTLCWGVGARLLGDVEEIEPEDRNALVPSSLVDLLGP